MAQELEELETERVRLLKELCELGDFRSGTISAQTRRCGKPTCHCSKGEDPGHPVMRITYKLKGKSGSESLASQAAIKKAEGEIAEYRRFQDLIQRLVEVNWNICRSRSTEGHGWSEAKGKKNERRRSNKKSGRR